MVPRNTAAILKGLNVMICTFGRFYQCFRDVERGWFVRQWHRTLRSPPRGVASGLQAICIRYCFRAFVVVPERRVSIFVCACAYAFVGSFCLFVRSFVCLFVRLLVSCAKFVLYPSTAASVCLSVCLVVFVRVVLVTHFVSRLLVALVCFVLFVSCAQFSLYPLMLSCVVSRV